MKLNTCLAFVITTLSLSPMTALAQLDCPPVFNEADFSKPESVAEIAKTFNQPLVVLADASRWVNSELIYNAEYDEYQVAPLLGDDPFQERLVWSDRQGEYIPAAMAKAEADWEYRNQLVWSGDHGEYVPRFVLEPCPSIAGNAALLRVAGLF